MARKGPAPGSKRVIRSTHEVACVICGKVFQGIQKNAKYCSRFCRKRADYTKWREKYKDKARKYYHTHKPDKRLYKKCKYWSDPERYRREAREWTKKNREKKRVTIALYKDFVRHGGLRECVILEHDFKCAICRIDTREGWRNSIAHHTTLDSTDHENQELLCRACHARLHAEHNRRDLK